MKVKKKSKRLAPVESVPVKNKVLNTDVVLQLAAQLEFPNGGGMIYQNPVFSINEKTITLEQARKALKNTFDILERLVADQFTQRGI